MPTVDPEFRDLIPPLTAEEFAGLEASIRAEGCRDPIVVWGDVILDGHNRHAICTKHGKPYNTTGLTFPNRDAAKLWIMQNQIARRNLNNYQRIEVVLKLEPLIAAEADARMKAGKADPMQNSAQGTTRDELAKLAGVSHETIRQAKVIHEKADEATRDRLRRGEATINAEYTRLQTTGRILSSESSEWYTPAEYVEAAREVLGGIDLDPASCETANETVKAARFFTREDDGLSREWSGRVFMNPPYCREAGAFIQRLVQHHEDGKVPAAIVLVNLYSASSDWFQPLWRAQLLCFVKGRIHFDSPSERSSSNTHGSIFAYLGPRPDRFVEVFRRFGPVVKCVAASEAA